MRHAHSGKIPFDCPFFSTAGHTLTGQSVMVGCSKYLGSLTVCPLARRKKGRMGFCYVRYCRGAGSFLASPTLALLEDGSRPTGQHQSTQRAPQRLRCVESLGSPNARLARGLISAESRLHHQSTKQKTLPHPPQGDNPAPALTTPENAIQ